MRYPLEPNAMQRRVFERWLCLCRQIYNAALHQRKDAWASQRMTVGYAYQCRDLTDLRKADSEYSAISVIAARSALRRLQKAYEAFFRRVKRGETPGHPRFKGTGWYDSFGIGRAKVEGKKVRIPKLGLVKFRLYRPLEGAIRDVTIKRTAKRWWVCFAVELGEAPAKRPVASTIGIDLGLKSFVALSNGETIENPRHFAKAHEKLAAHQRVLAKKKRGSRNRIEAKRLVARTHEMIANSRLDFHRKLAARLFERFDLVAHEDLNIKGMSAGLFAKSVNDAAWGQFVRCLHLKAERAGAWAVPVDPRGTSQRCSKCGATVPKELKDRVHRCPCGHVADRDVNAAENVLALGMSAAVVPGQSLDAFRQCQYSVAKGIIR